MKIPKITIILLLACLLHVIQNKEIPTLTERKESHIRNKKHQERRLKSKSINPRNLRVQKEKIAQDFEGKETKIKQKNIKSIYTEQ